GIALNVAAKARAFNLREGMTPEDETLAQAFFTPLKDSGAAITKDEMDFMFNDYQKIRNWTEKK
ncbi:MAG TPA: aldehyde ferredoxin oxidoreductase C-terminal domain-containing protein, partial [Desulfobacter postgatei]|nr:aldehyde ferredoxin oxidoreductase C-terminal domain-containing protein [Desulfobacter postgatei]